MDAKICDRCGEMWKDDGFCKVKMNTLILSKSSSHSDKLADYDLCNECYKGVFEYLKPVTKCEESPCHE